MTAPVTTPTSPAPGSWLPHRGYPDTPAFRGFFAPSRIEADVYDLEVDGDIPSELNGAFYRAASDTQFPPGGNDDIYINGDGMITMIRSGRAMPTCAPGTSARSGSSGNAPPGGPCSAPTATRSPPTPQ